MKGLQVKSLDIFNYELIIIDYLQILEKSFLTSATLLGFS